MRRLYFWTLSGVLCGIAVMVAIGLLAHGATEWWDLVVARELESSPYDLLFAAIASSNIVLIALYFTLVAVLVVGDTWEELDRELHFSTGWIFWPFLLEALSIAALGGRAWGFPPFSGALLALGTLGVIATVAYVKLAEHVLRLLAGPSRATGVRAPELLSVEPAAATPPGGWPSADPEAAEALEDEDRRLEEEARPHAR